MRFVLAAAIAFMATAPASAVTILGAITGGTTPGSFVQIAPPPVVGGNDLSSPNLFAFVERTNVTLAADLFPQIGGPILAGTRVSSFGVAFDPLRPALSVEGYVIFPRPILGVITSTLTLKNTDAFLGAPGTTYNSPGARGLEIEDFLGTSFVGNKLNISWLALSPGDNIRVITAAIPEPATWAMLIAGFGLVGFASRRRRSMVAA